MNPTTVIWLATTAAVIHVMFGALQSGTFNAALKVFSLPPINPKAFPWLGVSLGLGSGVIMGLQAGDPLGIALAKAVASMVSGGAAALHLETLRGMIAITSADGPSAPSAPAQAPQLPPATTPPAVPPTAHRRRLGWSPRLSWPHPIPLMLGALVFAFATLVAACGGSLGQVVQPVLTSPVPEDLREAYDCVQNDVDKKVTKVTDIEHDCLPGQLSAATALLETLLASKAFGEAHPDALPGLQREVASVRIGLLACPAAAK